MNRNPRDIRKIPAAEASIIFSAMLIKKVLEICVVQAFQTELSFWYTIDAEAMHW